MTPLKLALGSLARRGADRRHLARVRLTSPKTASAQQLLHELGRPAAEPHRPYRGAGAAAGARIGYPLWCVRPSYVLGGRAMEIVHGDNDLERLHARGGQGEREVTRAADRFLEHAI
jgi:carbamoyl-phosphate synthase large subunit